MILIQYTICIQVYIFSSLPLHILSAAYNMKCTYFMIKAPLQKKNHYKHIKFNTNIFIANKIKSTIISEEYVPISEDFPLINC